MSTYSRIKGVSDIRRLPRVGKIRLGVKKTTANGKQYPTEVDYFVVPDEVSDHYGEMPKELDIMFPSEDEHMIFPQAYKWWGNGVLHCRGNGETARRQENKLSDGDRQALGEAQGGYVEVACPCPLLESGKCKSQASIMVLLPLISLGGVYQIDTGSWNNIVNINSSIEHIRSITGGRISMIPLRLKRIPQEIQHDGKTRTHYLLKLDFALNIEQLNDIRENTQKIFSPRQKLVIQSPSNDETVIDQETQHPEEANGIKVLSWLDKIHSSYTIEALQKTWNNLMKEYPGFSPKEQSQLLRSKDRRKKELSTSTKEPANTETLFNAESAYD